VGGIILAAKVSTTYPWGSCDKPSPSSSRLSARLPQLDGCRIAGHNGNRKRGAAGNARKPAGDQGDFSARDWRPGDIAARSIGERTARRGNLIVRQSRTKLAISCYYWTCGTAIGLGRRAAAVERAAQLRPHALGGCVPPGRVPRGAGIAGKESASVSGKAESTILARAMELLALSKRLLKIAWKNSVRGVRSSPLASPHARV